MSSIDSKSLITMQAKHDVIVTFGWHGSSFDVQLYIFTICMLGNLNFSCFCGNKASQNILSGISSVSSGLDPDQTFPLVLIWVQAACKGYRYQQPTSFPKQGKAHKLEFQSCVGLVCPWKTVQTDEMPQNVAFHLGLHCLPIIHLFPSHNG